MKTKARKGKVIVWLLLTVLLICPFTMRTIRAADQGTANEVTEVKVNVTDDTQMNYFKYTAYEGKTWTVNNASEAYIDLGTSDANAQQCYYELTFNGNAVEIYAIKGPVHGKVLYTVDGANDKTVDLYQASRSAAQSVYQVSGLSEGKHTLKAVTLNDKSGSKIVNQISYAKVTHQPYTGTPDMGGTIKDTNYQYTQDQYATVSKENVKTAEVTAWKNDKAISELVLYSKNCSLKNVKVTASALTNGSETISADHVKPVFVKATKAYNGTYLGYGDKNRAVPADDGSNRSESSDILYGNDPVDVAWNQLQPVWVTFDIPKDAKAGTYTGTLSAAADGITTPLTFTYTVKVQDAVLPDASEFENSFDIELWQYPYSSAEYYGVTPFSEEHLKTLKPIMEKYKEAGGHAITTSIVEEAWNGQTYSKNEVHYPSMVKWTKNADGSFSYDYTDFDKWVSFNKELGIGDKIVLYSIAPWHNSFAYWENGRLKYESFTAGNARYQTVWRNFLTDLIAHLETKGWFEDAYIGIDERGFSTAAFDLIDSVTNLHGQTLKTAGAMDNFVNKKDLAMRVTDLNVGDTAAAAHPDEFAVLLEERESKGLRTTLYSCTEHIPGNFSLSMPAESYWSIINAGKSDTAGFLRWAYDAWVENPLEDATHNAFEPGDCFLIYPSPKDASEKEVKSSVRLERMAEGVRDVNKLRLMEREVPSLAAEIDTLYAGITTTAATGRRYLTADERTKLSSEMTAFKQGVATITEKYVAKKAAGTDKIESLTLKEGSELELSLGGTRQLTPVFTPENVLNTAVTYTSDDKSVVSVSAKGVLTAVRLGVANVTVTSKTDASKKATIRVLVKLEEVEGTDKISYYSFDKVNNKQIKDEWGTRNAVIADGTISTGKAGSALETAKTAIGANVSGASVSENAWTVSYWVCSKAVSDRSSVLMSSDQKYSFDVGISSSNLKAGVHVGTGAGDILTFNYTLPAETWVHMAWTQDKTNGLSLYVNGTLVQTNAWTKTNAFPCPADIIGGSGFEGKIDELKIYKRVLTANEIQGSMMGKGLNISETKKELKVGENWQIATNLISDLEDRTITYTSKNPEIASVNTDGTVQAKKRGNTQIIVKNEAGGYEETVEIRVTKEITIHNTVPVVQLDASKLSDIDKDETNAKGRRYLGQPDMVMLDDSRTLLTVYPVGHGHGKLVMQVSEDAGETWTEKTDIPSSWSKSLETPTIYKLHLANGKTRLMLITGLPNWGNGETDANGHIGGWNTSYSDDGGKTWTEYKNWHEKKKDGSTNYTIVAMASLVQLKDANGNDIQKWMGVYHDADYVNYKTYLTFDENGNEQWSEPEKYLSEYRAIESTYQMCEIGMFRSPDGERIVGLARSQSHNNPSTLIYSDDEGETWSEPMDLPGSLAGERHKALYDPVSGKLVITFREIQYDLNKNNQFDGANDWMAGDWVAWVGTYEDLMEQNEGQCHILLCEDWANNRYSGDTGYTGMVVLPDGTFVMDSYGHWDKAFSQSWKGTDGSGYNVKTDLCYIKQAKFKLADVIRGSSVVAVSSVKLNKTEATLTEKRQTVQLTATVEPSTATNKNVTYTTGNKAVATVTSDGLVTAVANGTADITVTTEDGNRTAVCKVTVNIKDSKPDEQAEVLDQVKTAIKAADSKKQSDYTKETWDAYQKALTDARAVAEKAGATKEELEMVLKALKAAETKLEKVSGGQIRQPETPATETPAAKIPAVGTTKTVGKAIYKVTKSDAKNGTVTLLKLTSKNEKKFTVPAAVKVDGVSFKVTEISRNAFKNNKKLKQVTVGKNVTKIGANAFSGDKSLKKITIKSAKLKKAGKKAFKGIHAKCKIKVPKKKLSAYKRLLKGKGQKAGVKITK